MSQKEKFQDFEHPYSLSKYFQKKGIDSNNVMWKRQNTNGFIKEQSFLSSGSKTYSLHKEKKGTSMLKAWVLLVFILLRDSSFIMGTEDSSVKRKLYESSII